MGCVYLLVFISKNNEAINFVALKLMPCGPTCATLQLMETEAEALQVYESDEEQAAAAMSC